MKRCPRKPATAATGYVRWEGATDGITVTAGAIIQRDDLTEYTESADASAVAGVLRVPVLCSVTGTAGNTDDGITLRLASPIEGLSSAGAADTLRDGNDEEALETWRARVIERWYMTPQSGADQDYVIWAKEVEGVTRAWTYRHWLGIGTVGVMVANDDLVNPIPDKSVAEAAWNHINPLAPVAGSSLSVFIPIAKVVNFSIRLTPDTAAIRFAVLAELRALCQRSCWMIAPSRFIRRGILQRSGAS